MKLEDYRDLVHTVVKDITWIGTEISEDKQSIDIKINFASQLVTIPIKLEDIKKNLYSAKSFLRLIKLPLEALLKPYIRKE